MLVYLLADELNQVAEKVCKSLKLVPFVLTANNVPVVLVPLVDVVPNNMLLDKTNPASGMAPSMFVAPPEMPGEKLDRMVKVCAEAASASMRSKTIKCDFRNLKIIASSIGSLKLYSHKGAL